MIYNPIDVPEFPPGKEPDGDLKSINGLHNEKLGYSDGDHLTSDGSRLYCFSYDRHRHFYGRDLTEEEKELLTT
jgi:hypothetical protein